MDLKLLWLCGCLVLALFRHLPGGENLAGSLDDAIRNSGLPALIASLSNASQEIDGKLGDISSSLDELKASASGKNPRKRRRSGKYDANGPCIMAIWESGVRELRGTLNTRVTHEAVFALKRAELAAFGVMDLRTFKRILHAMQNRKYNARKAELERCQDAAKNRPWTGTSAPKTPACEKGCNAAPVAKLAETVVRAAKNAELRSSPRGGRRSSSAMASAG